MAVSTRDVLVVIRARDVASRVIQQVGLSFAKSGSQAQQLAHHLFGASAALTGAGVAIGGLGAIGLSFWSNMVQGAMEYNTASRMTLTQVDLLGVGLEDVKDIGRRVASEIPAPFEQMQTALFDIFSSIDTNLAGAENLLESFSKAAVAGQVDIIEASRATIGLMNAFKIPLSDVNSVLDIQFQLVRKGIITYQELTSTIGRASPSFVAADQDIETLAGTIAFLTRNGLSAAMSATSAARAMELMANPKAVGNIENLGISVRDSEGHFRQLNEIVTDLAEGPFKDLTGPEFRKAFIEIFGQGQIQARRFFDVALKNFDELNERVGDMHNAAGAMEAAYKIMFEDPAVQLQLLKNRWQVLRTELGDQLLPAFVRMVEVGQSVLKFFTELPDSAKKALAFFGAGTSLLLLFSGALLLVAGGLTALMGVMVAFGASAGAAALTAGALSAALLLLPAAIALIIANWDGLVDMFNRAPGVFMALASVITGVLVGIAIAKLLGALSTMAMWLATLPGMVGAATTAFGAMATGLAVAAPWIALVGAALGGLAAFLLMNKVRNEEAARANTDLVRAMQEQNSVIGQNTREWSRSFFAENDLAVTIDQLERMDEAMNFARQGRVTTFGLTDFARELANLNDIPVPEALELVDEWAADYQRASEVFREDRIAGRLRDLGSAVAQAEGSMSSLFSTAEEAQEWETAFSDAIKGATDPVEAMGDSWENAFARWRSGMEMQLASVARWQTNLAALAAQGRTDLMTEVAAIGPELAPVLDDALRQGAPALDRMEALFAERGQLAGEGFMLNFTDAMQLLSSFKTAGPLPISAFRAFGAETRDQAQALVDDVNARLESIGSPERIRLQPVEITANAEDVQRETSLAQSWLQFYRDTRAEARLTADGSEARGDLRRLLGSIRASWVATVFEGTIDADSRPARRAFQAALSQGRNFDVQHWAAMLDVDNDPAMNAIDEARRAAEDFAQRSYTAHLNIMTTGGFGTPGLGVESFPAPESGNRIMGESIFGRRADRARGAPQEIHHQTTYIIAKDAKDAIRRVPVQERPKVRQHLNGRN